MINSTATITRDASQTQAAGWIQKSKNLLRLNDTLRAPEHRRNTHERAEAQRNEKQKQKQKKTHTPHTHSQESREALWERLLADHQLFELLKLERKWMAGSKEQLWFPSIFDATIEWSLAASRLDQLKSSCHDHKRRQCSGTRLLSCYQRRPLRISTVSLCTQQQLGRSSWSTRPTTTTVASMQSQWHDRVHYAVDVTHYHPSTKANQTNPSRK